MKLTLHHINLATDDIARMDAFYREVLGLTHETAGLPVVEKSGGSAGNVTFVADGAVQPHLARHDRQAGSATGQIAKPVCRDHIAYRTDDLTAFRAHLDKRGVPYSDRDNKAVAGWHQISFYDPDGNVIEVHQAGAAATGSEPDLLADLEAAERQVWDALTTGDRDSDAALLDDGFVGIYPDGFAGKQAHADQLADGPTITAYELAGLRCMPLGSGHAVLAYQARFTRAGRREPEQMYVSSIWKRGPRGWVNLLSQDTPATA